MHVDISEPGTVNSANQVTPLDIPAGTVVNSTYLHHDQPGIVQNTQTASWTFDTDVLGIIVLYNNLVASNGQLGAPLTLYHTAQTVRVTNGLVGARLRLEPRIRSLCPPIGGLSRYARMSTVRLTTFAS